MDKAIWYLYLQKGMTVARMQAYRVTERHTKALMGTALRIKSSNSTGHSPKISGGLDGFGSEGGGGGEISDLSTVLIFSFCFFDEAATVLQHCETASAIKDTHII